MKMGKFGLVVAILQTLVLFRPCSGQRVATSLGVKTKKDGNSDQLTFSKAKGMHYFDLMGPYLRCVFALTSKITNLSHKRRLEPERK